MDRMFLLPGQLITDVLFESSEKNTMLALGHLARAILGTGPVVAGLACTPTSPASMQVTVGTGSIYALENVDGTAYGSLAADTTDQVVKQGLLSTAFTASCPAPTASGQSIAYLIAAAYQDQDTGNQVSTFFNSTNPAMPFSGPGNDGASLPTVRQGICAVQVVAGTAATTGSQVTPATPTGYSPLYVVTVAYGATTITSANIAAAPGSPFIPYTLPQLKPGFSSQVVLSGSGNFIVPSPTIKITGCGGGGGAGGISTTGQGGAGGGGGGEFFSIIRTGLTVGASIAYSVGAGGAASTAGGSTPGATGGTTTFGSYATVAGGAGGTGNASGLGGAGGTSTHTGALVNDIFIAGMYGTGSLSTGTAVGGQGGGSAFGGFGGAPSGASNPIAGQFPGGGGGGMNSLTSGPGGAGANGWILVEY
jgi:hypothetical protein